MVMRVVHGQGFCLCVFGYNCFWAQKTGPAIAMMTGPNTVNVDYAPGPGSAAGLSRSIWKRAAFSGDTTFPPTNEPTKPIITTIAPATSAGISNPNRLATHTITIAPAPATPVPAADPLVTGPTWPLASICSAMI